MKKTLLGAAGYLLVTFPLGYFWFLVLFKRSYETFGVYNRPQPIIPLGLFSMIIQGPILAHLYPRWRGDGPRLSSALQFCLLMGLFFASGTVIALAAKAQIADLPLWFGINFAFTLIQFTLTAVVFAAVFD
ncbi:MAG TPA: DUF1761 domain-containing protein [Elusimicrobiota bacterium]|nr:DUF1761 domain-containing protein [Elusimicrobiota bacterium]